ncbi:Zn(II)-responsive regulator of zntA [Morganella morganii]|nr:Zn(II)-responsive regulator of zntA [Morganella morganii]
MYRIGQLAKLAEVTPDTIRFYEKQGMMDHQTRTDGGYRLYTEQDLHRLRFIRYAKQLGFTLEAITELLSIRVDPEHHTCRESKQIVDDRLKDVETKLVEMQRMRDSLKMLSDACWRNGTCQFTMHHSGDPGTRCDRALWLFTKRE